MTAHLLRPYVIFSKLFGMHPLTSKQELSSSTRLLGKTALVTGASRGIGASVTRQLGHLGVDVAINYRTKKPRAQEVGTT